MKHQCFVLLNRIKQSLFVVCRELNKVDMADVIFFVFMCI
jgi:hypothetical protein